MRPSFGANLPQIVTHIWQKAFFKHALEIDLLVIKKNEDILIENEIGRIFRRHNIIEYKSPHDREGINTYFKTHAYASLYKIGEGSISYEPEEITLTMIRRGKPYKLFKWLERHGCSVNEVYKGGYYIENAGFFKTQVIVAKELDEESHIWLTALTDNMDRQQAEHLLNRSKIMMNRPEADCADAVMQIVAKANRTLFEEIIKEEKNMRAFVELMQPEFDEAVKKAANETANRIVNETINEAVDKAVNEAVDKAVNEAVDKAWDKAVIETTNIVTAQNKVEAIENAIRKLNMTKEEACDFMDITTTQYDTYKQILQDAAGTIPQK